MIASKTLKKYVLYPNEPVDKLSVNRSLNNLFDAIEQIESTSESFTITNATTAEYGLVKQSEAKKYLARDNGESYYSDSSMGFNTLLSFSNKQTNITDIKKYIQYQPSTAITGTDENYNTFKNYYLKLNSGECNCTEMCNGIKLVLLSLDFGINDLPMTFGSEVYSGSIDSPISVSSFSTKLIFDENSSGTIELNKGSINNISSVPIVKLFDNQELKYSYPFDIKSSIHFNECNWKTYSSYKQAFVEVSFTTEISVIDIYDKLYGYTAVEQISSTDVSGGINIKYDDTILNTGEITNSGATVSIPKESFPKTRSPFNEKPIILMQVSNYTNDSRKSILYGQYNMDDGTDVFIDEDKITESDLSVQEIGNNFNNETITISLVNGGAVLKSYNNEYSKSGKLIDNKIGIDVHMKFFAGSVDDPLMTRTIKNINAKSCLQILLVGV